ncbi:MAG: uracil-DNA glycosylase [Gammaproteobacteria bacterium]|nr:uracil-DNA glycosylase [Gammaproteobacteria bacterium]
MSQHIKLEPGWLAQLQPEFEQDYMQQLRAFLRARIEAGAQIYPVAKNIFAAFDHTPFAQVRVVIIGQDPYHGPGQAHGLCFSVLPGTKVPPSLHNIYRELHSDVGFAPPQHGCLLPWAAQGVLLLNAVLTVERGQAGAHQNRGWERFTDAAIAALNAQRDGLVFMLWGSYAQRKGSIVDRQKHLVLQAPHPSPLSAHRGFLGCRHFSQSNAWLQSHGQAAIDWQLPAQVQAPPI